MEYIQQQKATISELARGQRDDQLVSIDVKPQTGSKSQKPETAHKS